jgi:hypothetical protein
MSKKLSVEIMEFKGAMMDLAAASIHIFTGFSLETSTSEFWFIGFLANVNVLIGTVSTEVNSFIIFLRNMHAKVEEELLGLAKVRVTIGL